jgi:outer membrane receptor for ferric coprogen and ferric-rhodotorulic acid
MIDCPNFEGTPRMSSHSTTRRHLRPSLLVLSVSLAVAELVSLSYIAPAYAQSSTTRTWDLPAASLGETLARIARDSGYRLSVNPALISGKSSAAIRGNFTPVEAARRAVAGNGLDLHITDSGTLTVQQSTQNEATLPEVSVQGQTGNADNARLEVTEGTGRYAAKVGTTALPFNTTLRDTPQSVSVVTRQLIEDNKLTNFIDAVASTPGVSVRQYESNRATINVRGLEVNDYMIDGIPTTTVFDSRYTAGEIFNDLSIYDRVEVVRGSAGLTTATGNPSAVVNLVRKRADSKTFKGTVTAEAGSWNNFGGMIDISTPISKSGDTRARFVGNFRDKDSYINLLNNKTSTFYGTVEHDLTPQTRLSAGISRQEDRNKGVMWGGLPAWAGQQFGSWEPLPRWDQSKTVAADWTRWDADYTNWFLSAEHVFDNGWKAKANYTHGERNSTSKMLLLFPVAAPDGTSSGLKSSGIYSTNQTHDGFNLQVDGDVTLLNRVHQLAFGLDYSTQESESYNRLGAGALPNGNIYTWTGQNYPEPTFMASQFARRDKDETKSVYAAGRFSLADPLKVIVGGNYVSYSSTNTAANLTQSTVEFNKFIPYAGVTFDITPWLSVYSSYTRILKPQNVRDVSGRVLNPVSGNNKEIGLKGQFFDDRLNASIAWFKTERQNQKIYDSMVAGETRYKESSNSESKGYEIEITGEILPDWQITAGYTKVNASYNNDIVNMTSIAANEKLDATLIPEKQFKLFTSYKMPGSWSGLTIGGGVTWQSETYQSNPTSFFGMPLYDGVVTRQEAYTVVNLMARYQFTPQLSAQLNINNVFDKAYYGITEDALQVYRQTPRSALLTLKYQF